MGHATRMVPVIEKLLERNVEVVLAANGDGRHFLQDRFPSLPMLTDSPDMEVKYRKNLVLGLLLDSPKFLKLVSDERRWLEDVLSKEKFDLVISDNRYGLQNARVHSVIVTHQLNIQAGGLSKPANVMNHTYLNKFDECWVPDDPVLNLAGDLSKAKVSVETSLVGPLTRFSTFKESRVEVGRVLCLVSGPEPMRTEFETKLRQLMNSHSNWKLLQGKPGGEVVGDNILPHLNDELLLEEISRADLIVCRSGYSTLMDVYDSPAKLLLVPTPGQSEQEYLASHWRKMGWAEIIGQQELTFTAIERAITMVNSRKQSEANTHLDKAVDYTLAKLSESASLSN